MSNLPTWAEYVRFTDETAAYPGLDMNGYVPDYVYYGLRSEIGELCGVLKRSLRDDGDEWTPARLAELRAEIGDCLWYCARYEVHEETADEEEGADFMTGVDTRATADDRSLIRALWTATGTDDVGYVLWLLRKIAGSHGWNLAEIAAENMAKLRDRKARGVIQGKGDKR